MFSDTTNLHQVNLMTDAGVVFEFGSTQMAIKQNFDLPTLKSKDMNNTH